MMTTTIDDEIDDCRSPNCRQFNQTFAEFTTVHAAAAPTPTVTSASHLSNPQIYAIGGSAAAAIVLAGLVAGLLISRNHRRKMAALQNGNDTPKPAKRNASVPAVSMANAPRSGHSRRNQSTPNISFQLQEADVVRRQSMTFSKLTHPRALAPSVPVPALPEAVLDSNKPQDKHAQDKKHDKRGGDGLQIPKQEGGGRTRTLSSVHRDGSLNAGHELYGFI